MFTLRSSFILLLTGFCYAAHAAETPAAADFFGGTQSGTVGVRSENFDRGLSLTAGDPGMFGVWNYQHPSGFYLELEGTSVELESANFELDITAAYVLQHGPWEFEAGVTYASFPGAKPAFHYAYAEPYVSATYDLDVVSINGSFSYSPNFTLDSGQAYYPHLGITLPVKAIKDFSVDVGIGHQWVEDNAAFGLKDYTDWEIGAEKSFGDFTLRAEYVGTSLGGDVCKDLCGDRVVVTLARNF